FWLGERGRHEADIFVVGGRGLRDQERAPEAALDVAPNVVPDALLVQPLQVCAVARNDDVAETMPILARPGFCFVLAVFQRHVSPLGGARSQRWPNGRTGIIDRDVKYQGRQTLGKCKY